MKIIKKLMAQHGGYIPFTALGGTKTSSKTNSSKRRNSRTKAKAKKAKKLFVVNQHSWLMLVNMPQGQL